MRYSRSFALVIDSDWHGLPPTSKSICPLYFVKSSFVTSPFCIISGCHLLLTCIALLSISYAIYSSTSIPALSNANLAQLIPSNKLITFMFIFLSFFTMYHCCSCRLLAFPFASTTKYIYFLEELFIFPIYLCHVTSKPWWHQCFQWVAPFLLYSRAPKPSCATVGFVQFFHNFYVWCHIWYYYKLCNPVSIDYLNWSMPTVLQCHNDFTSVP